MTKPIAVIPARAGSTRVPGKNKRHLRGHPLWEWSAKWAEKAGCTVVVASDDEEILHGATECGYEPILRPTSHCNEMAGLDEAVDWVLRTFRHRSPNLWDERIVILQPTSPFRSNKLVRKAVDMLDAVESVVGVVRDPSAYFRWGVDGPLYEGRPRTQDIRLWRECGALYAFRWGAFCATGNRVCGRAARLEMSPWAGLDIDDEFDWDLCEALAAKMLSLSPFAEKSDGGYPMDPGVVHDSAKATDLEFAIERAAVHQRAAELASHELAEVRAELAVLKADLDLGGPS